MNPTVTKNKSKMSVRKDKDYRKLQQELTREKDKFDQHVAKLQRDLQDSQQQLLEEQQTRLRLAMEVDSKDVEIEQLKEKLAALTSETASQSSADAEDGETEQTLEGWLSVPIKQNIRRHGWRKQYVVVSSKKIIFYNTESDKQNTTDPVMILDLRYVCRLIICDDLKPFKPKYFSKLIKALLLLCLSIKSGIIKMLLNSYSIFY